MKKRLFTITLSCLLAAGCFAAQKTDEFTTKNGKKVNGSSEYATYYIFDFSTSGHFDVEVGYDSGMDI